MRRIFLPCLFVAVTAFAADEKDPAAGPFVETGSVRVSSERQFDFTSRLNGLPYRLMIAAPKAEPGKRYPVFFVLDGNWYFRAASDTAGGRGSGFPEPAVVVGIGYPTEERTEINKRRALDLTVAVEEKRFSNGSGGCDTFLRVIEEEIKPFIAARYPIDPARYMLYGKSIGGLAVLRALFRTPGNFSTYIAASPSIWQGDRAVLADEAAFSEKVRSGALKLRLLITSASGEEYTGPDPALRAAEEANGMVANARNLADRLKILNPDKVAVRFTLFQDEDHASVSLASIARAVTFALPPPPPPTKAGKKKSK